MDPGFQPLDPRDSKSADRPARPRRKIPLRLIFPNLVTALAMCAGLTAIRMAIEGRIELAVFAILLAAFLDGIDGRIARFLKASSKFGAELDSLADFLSFGVAPAIVLFVWGLQDFRSLGWIACLIFAVCCALRLARFNAALENPGREPWHANYFTGIPAPAGAAIGLFPVYISFLIVPMSDGLQLFTLVYVVFVALLMVSNIPTFSGKSFGGSIRPDFVFPGIIAVVIYVSLLATYPWTMLAGSSILYLAIIPVSWRGFVKRRRKSESAQQQAEPDKPEI